jgi:two-component system NarL family response regulator
MVAFYSGGRVDSAFGRARDKEQATVRRLTRIRALVADDSPDFRTVIVALLKMEDRIEVIARVSDGREAIEAVALFLPDLILMDVGLAELDGITTASILSHRFPSLDVVLMSDKHSSRLRATCQASGAKYFIHKPRFNEEFPQLFTQFKSLLQSHEPK